MTKLKLMFSFTFLLVTTAGCLGASADVDTRQKVISAAKKVGLDDRLNMPVEVSADDNGIVCIADKGKFFMQYMIEGPEKSADARVITNADLNIPASCTKAVIVTHGWLDKADSDWPMDLAEAIRKKTDPNEWVCAYFDWQGGAKVPNPVDAAKYAKTIGAERLAKAFFKLGPEFQHVHIISHSAGSWLANAAAKIISEKTNPTIHLTFLDAYVPPRWKQAQLANIQNKPNLWAEHYYTKDITLKSTHRDLKFAHNVDISAIDGVIKEHEFPYRWYLATVTGKFRPGDREKKEKVITKADALNYGFSRSRQAGRKNWQKSLTLNKGNKAVKILTSKPANKN